METILKTIHLTKTFGHKKGIQTTVLNNINLSVQKGEFVAIMGRSGSGKSTLLYTMSGMDKPSSGQTFFHGKDIAQLSDEAISTLRLHHMGFIFQHSHLLNIMSIKENIMLPAIKAKKKTKNEITATTNQLLHSVDIASIQNHAITEVSGGELQRAAICRALVNNPDIIFGDEPTGALNTESSKQVMDILNAINQTKTTVLIVTHDAKVAARADRVIYLSDGHIEAEFTMDKYDRTIHANLEREKELVTWLNERGF